MDDQQFHSSYDDESSSSAQNQINNNQGTTRSRKANESYRNYQEDVLKRRSNYDDDDVKDPNFYNYQFEQRVRHMNRNCNGNDGGGPTPTLQFDRVHVRRTQTPNRDDLGPPVEVLTPIIVHVPGKGAPPVPPVIRDGSKRDKAELQEKLRVQAIEAELLRQRALPFVSRDDDDPWSNNDNFKYEPEPKTEQEPSEPEVPPDSPPASPGSDTSSTSIESNDNFELPSNFKTIRQTEQKYISYAPEGGIIPNPYPNPSNSMQGQEPDPSSSPEPTSRRTRTVSPNTTRKKKKHHHKRRASSPSLLQQKSSKRKKLTPKKVKVEKAEPEEREYEEETNHPTYL